MISKALPPPCVLPPNKYDLAICLEMAEHVSEGQSAHIVDILTQAADVVYFSGATPFSGGVHHVNERWQTYWINKFKKRGFKVIDCLRPRLWYEKQCCYFYAQESFVFVREDKLSNYEKLCDYVQEPIYDCVHPELFVNQVVKPSHDWEYLISIQKRLLRSFWTKFMNRARGQ